MNWLDALDLADSFWEDASDLPELCSCAERELIAQPSLTSDSPTLNSDMESLNSQWLESLSPIAEEAKQAKRRCRWTGAEDEMLEMLAEKYRNDWGKLAEFLPRHSAAAIQKRWKNKIDPQYSKGKWTPEEDEMICRLYEQEGGNWVKLAKSVPGRHPDQIKNRYYGTLRKKQHELSQKPRSQRGLGLLGTLLTTQQDQDLASGLMDSASTELSNLTFSEDIISERKAAKKRQLQELQERISTLEDFINRTKEHIERLEEEID
jgi:myb proto-oncogene protein